MTSRAAHFGKTPHPTYPPTLGARLLAGGKCGFRVWAPRAQSVEVKLIEPEERLLAMEPAERGYFQMVAEGIEPGSQYFYRIDGQHDRPDPASRFQPHGVHGPSAVVDPTFNWSDSHWAGIGLNDYITYELHVGTFSPEGTFEGAIAYLDDLCELGITAIGLMPVAQFPGGRNWGYDGVHPFAAQDTYGGPLGLQRLVDACHARNLAVVLDVVYNHLGPEGNYLGEFGDYFTERYRTPWGAAVNFDGPGSDEVRRFFIENALYWISELHIDALRLDAVHAIFDFSARPFLQELADAVRLEGQRRGRQVFTIAESSLNDTRLIRPKEQWGCGVDAQWCDDLHHALRTALTDQRSGYYEDYRGFPDVVKAYRDGFVLDGVYSAYRGRRHGNSARDIAPEKLVVCSQNHDQVGNRLLGERLTELVSFEELKLAAAAVLLSPFQPMLFMGEEYGEPARFQYFISHIDPGLIEAVRQGRKEEFSRFRWQEEPPDPQDQGTFERCKLNHHLKREGRHRILWEYYKSLIGLRKGYSSLAYPDRERMQSLAVPGGELLLVRRGGSDAEVVTLFHFGESHFTASVPMAAGRWTRQLDSADPRWEGPGSDLPNTIESSGEVPCSFAPRSVAVFVR